MIFPKSATILTPPLTIRGLGPRNWKIKTRKPGRAYDGPRWSRVFACCREVNPVAAFSNGQYLHWSNWCANFYSKCEQSSSLRISLWLLKFLFIKLLKNKFSFFSRPDLGDSTSLPQATWKNVNRRSFSFNISKKIHIFSFKNYWPKFNLCLQKPSWTECVLNGPPPSWFMASPVVVVVEENGALVKMYFGDD